MEGMNVFYKRETLAGGPSLPCPCFATEGIATSELWFAYCKPSNTYHNSLVAIPSVAKQGRNSWITFINNKLKDVPCASFGTLIASEGSVQTSVRRAEEVRSAAQDATCC